MNGLGAYLRTAANNRAPSGPRLDVNGGFSIANVIHEAFDIDALQVDDSFLAE